MSRIPLKTVALVAGLAALQTVSAYDLPSVNLGATSFLDGGPPAGPGWYFQEYIQIYRNGRLKDADGDDVRLPTPRGLEKAEAEVNASITQVLYQSDQELLWGGKWGLNFMQPIVGLDLDPDDNFALSANSANLGDLLIGPYLQWDPVMSPNGPRFMHRVEFQMILPTGAYDADRALNPGSNFFSFNPYWAATVFITPKWTASWRLHYLWNAENSDPHSWLGADDSQAGQAIHVNFASAYEVLPKRLRIGINGYYLKQITDDKIDGHEVSDTKEQVLGIGPGLVYHVSQNDHLFFNAYWETAAENRTEGSKVTLRYVHHF